MTDEAASKGGIITFTVETTGQVYRFDTFKELQFWVDQQCQSWKVLSEQKIYQALLHLSSQASNVTRNTFSHLQSNLQKISPLEPPKGSETEWSDSQILEHLKELGPWLEPIILGYVPTADSAKGEEILVVANEDPKRAATLLVLAVKHKDVDLQGLPNYGVLRAILDAIIIPDENTKTTSVDTQLLKLRQRWDGKLTSLLRDLEKRRNLEDQARDKFKTDIAKGRQLFRQLFTTSNQERYNHKEEMDRIKDTFHTHLALQAPATYWTTKQTQHIVVATLAGLLFFGLSGLAIWLAWSHGPTFVKDVTEGKEGFNMGAFAMITIPALVGAWAMRFVARVFVSNLHLGQDAGLRSTMITTYLALMKDPDSGVTREERALILNAMFRSADHRGDDDGPSPKLIDLMQKMAGR